MSHLKLTKATACNLGFGSLIDFVAMTALNLIAEGNRIHQKAPEVDLSARDPGSTAGPWPTAKHCYYSNSTDYPNP